MDGAGGGGSKLAALDNFNVSLTDSTVSCIFNLRNYEFSIKKWYRYRSIWKSTNYNS